MSEIVKWQVLRGILTAVVIVTVRYFPKKTCFFNPPPLATEKQDTGDVSDRVQAPFGNTGKVDPSTAAKSFPITDPLAVPARHKTVCCQ